MENEKEKKECLKFIQKLKDKGKSYTKFDESLASLQNYATKEGLEDESFDLLTDVIIHVDLGAKKLVSLVKCLIPRSKVPSETLKLFITWYLSSQHELPITVSTISIQWIIGLWDYQLADRKVIDMFYDVLFYIMLKKQRLELYFARLIYVLTKPEDVTRRNVSRLLTLHQKSAKVQKHVIALLSLFKSYKPELVPEKILSVNIESVWKPIPEVLRLSLKGARDRLETQQIEENSKTFNWNTLAVTDARKTKQCLLPPLGYFQIGSSIFKDKDTKSIFDIFNMEELGKFQSSIELPCNIMSLLTNMAGYHLLTFADLHLQSRFSYNLYNTFKRAFILEKGKFPSEEIDKLLDMTIEFSRYMQQGIPVINLFLDEYLYLNTGEYQLKLLQLVTWMSPISIIEHQKKILSHIQNMFYESTLGMKCEIIKTLKMLVINLFINHGMKECYQTAPSLFLRQGTIDNLKDVIHIVTKISQDLITSGLIIHSFNILLLSEALSFYEEICTVENRSNMLPSILAVPAVIYGSFLSESCAILSKVCKLLLRYLDMYSQARQCNIHLPEDRLQTISIYIQDINSAIWHDQPFSDRDDSYLSINFTESLLQDLQCCNTDSFLNVANHYAILPYKHVLSETGLSIKTKEDAVLVALNYYPAVSEFVSAFSV